MKFEVRKLVYGALLVAVGVVLPQAFHLFGQAAGKVFLPMHIPVLLAGFLIGPYWGAIVAILSPVLSNIITGGAMPPIPMLYFMIFELLAYAIVAGMLSGKMNMYFALIITLICGRVVYGLALVVATYIFQASFPFASATAFFGGILSGLPGIAIQLVFVPPILYALKRGGFSFEQKNA